MTEARPSPERFDHCSICKIPRHAVTTLIAGKDACICPGCTLGVHKTMSDQAGVRVGIRTSFDEDVQKPLIPGLVAIAIVIIALVVTFFIYR